MQTFMPDSDFYAVAKTLDYKRLGKQRVEAMQIYKALHNPDYGWQNHPAVKMWRGYEDALALYHNIMIDEWVDRGYNNTMKHLPYKVDCVYPDWIYDEDVLASHRSNLLRKYPDHYSQFGWTEPDDLEYVWRVIDA